MPRTTDHTTRCGRTDRLFIYPERGACVIYARQDDNQCMALHEAVVADGVPRDGRSEICLQFGETLWWEPYVNIYEVVQTIENSISATNNECCEGVRVADFPQEMWKHYSRLCEMAMDEKSRLNVMAL